MNRRINRLARLSHVLPLWRRFRLRDDCICWGLLRAFELHLDRNTSHCIALGEVYIIWDDGTVWDGVCMCHENRHGHFNFNHFHPHSSSNGITSYSISST